MQGLDATIDQVFDKDGKLTSAVDFRFKNSTESYLLIQARTDKKNLTFQIYGKKTGWEVKVDKPRIDNVVKSDPTPVKQLDPKMPIGSEMLIESAQDGFRAQITRRVTAGNAVIEQETFTSTYRPSRNVYLVGPRPTASPTASPTRTPTATAGSPSPAASPSPPPELIAPTGTPKPVTPTPSR